MRKPGSPLVTAKGQAGPDADIGGEGLSTLRPGRPPSSERLVDKREVAKVSEEDTMNSIVRRITVFGVAVLLMGVVAWPAAAREPAQVRINKGSSALQDDGNARIALRARCDANLAAFELDIEIWSCPAKTHT